MTTAAAIQERPRGITPHRVAMTAFAGVLAGIFFYAFAAGVDYYLKPLSERPFHPLHHELRPSGRVGITFGVFSCILFAAIYLYPLRKRWTWLREFASARHWLDFHIAMGLATPFLVALHASFKFSGLAGMAYWIMLAVVASGVVGRYLYAQIPRSMKDAELSLTELQKMTTQMGEDLLGQNVIGEEIWRPLMNGMRREEALKMPLVIVLARMLATDLMRPFRMAELRRQVLPPSERITTMGGFLASSHPDLERVVALARRQSWLTGKICFLDRAEDVFKLWHVVHRPFSMAFLILVAIHIGMALWMGFL